MYTGKNKATSASNYDIGNFIEGYDIYNSSLLKILGSEKVGNTEIRKSSIDLRPDVFSQRNSITSIEDSVLMVNNRIFEWSPKEVQNIKVPNTDDIRNNL